MRNRPARQRGTKPGEVTDRIIRLARRAPRPEHLRPGVRQRSDDGEMPRVTLERQKSVAIPQQDHGTARGFAGKGTMRLPLFLAQGRAAASQVPKRRLAAQLAQLRKDIARQNTTAAMLNKQIDIISTDIHNLTLIQQGQLAKLPDTADLTENAVRAEEMLEGLKADAELVGSLETGLEETLTSEEELAILREFDEVEGKAPAAAESAAPAETPPAPQKVDTTRPVEAPADEPPTVRPEAERRPADPEVT